MDQNIHQLIVLNNQQNEKLSSLIKKVEEQNELMIQTNSILRELLNFFVSIDRRDQGLESEASQEYLTELEKDGFSPPSG